MRNVCFKKGLVFGIIVLFLGVGATSSGINVNANPKNVLKDNSEVEPLGDYIEIISRVSGSGYDYSGGGFFELNIVDGSVDIKALTLLNGIITGHAEYIYARFFIGLRLPVANYWYNFGGWAFGDIVWY